MSLAHAPGGIHVGPLSAAATRPDLHTPAIIGHRGMGGSHRHPGNPWTENTRASFLAAHAAGASWIELDIHPTADGDLVLHHDHHHATGIPTWRRPTRDLLSEGVEPLDGLCADLPADLGFYLELKSAPGDADPAHGPTALHALLAWANDHAAHRDILVASFNPYALLEARDAGLATAWITGHHFPLHTAVTGAVQAGLDAVVVHGTTLDALDQHLASGYALAADHRLAIWTWHPSLDRLPVLRAAGATGFCVDAVADAAARLRGALPRPAA
jgi:glycerophosphoryl diester phosphodiesterase